MRVLFIASRQLAVYITLAMPVLVGCSYRTVLTADDVIVLDGQEARFAASLFRDYGSSFHSDITGAEVRFTVNGRVVARGLTNHDGRVIATGRVEPGAYTFEAQTQVAHETIKADGPIYRWSPERTVIAVDMDETVSRTNYSDLFFADFDGSQPIPGAREVLWKLSKEYELVYISARPEFLQDKTRHWLRQHGFPPAPYMGADRFAACLDQEGYKRRMLADLRSRWPNVLIGIGDKKVDDLAYGNNGMLALIVNQSPFGIFTQRCLMMRDWPTLYRFFQAHEERLLKPRQLAGLIRENGDRLRLTFAEPPAAKPPANPQAPQIKQAGQPEAAPVDSSAVVQRPSRHDPSF